MIIKRHKRTGIISLVFGVALILGMSASGATAQKTTVKKTRVAIGLDTKTTTRAELVTQIKQQLNARGVSASDREVQDAAQRGLNLIGKTKDPQKGIIYIPARKFTICISWGPHKKFCDTH